MTCIQTNQQETEKQVSFEGVEDFTFKIWTSLRFLLIKRYFKIYQLVVLPFKAKYLFSLAFEIKFHLSFVTRIFNQSLTAAASVQYEQATKQKLYFTESFDYE